jgi:hypothetical protein
VVGAEQLLQPHNPGTIHRCDLAMHMPGSPLTPLPMIEDFLRILDDDLLTAVQAVVDLVVDLIASWLP